jgi:hypothetical protein
MDRRKLLLGGLVTLFAAPAIVRASSLMAISSVRERVPFGSIVMRSPLHADKTYYIYAVKDARGEVALETLEADRPFDLVPAGNHTVIVPHRAMTLDLTGYAGGGRINIGCDDEVWAV